MATITPDTAPPDPTGVDPAPRDGKRERMKREDPARSSPIRNATTYFREAHSWDDGAPEQGAGTGPETPVTEKLDDVITRGVHLGYKVIEEHIRKGQRTARELRQSSPQAQDGSDDFAKFVEQAQRLYQDVGTLCFDALETLVHSPALLRRVARAVQMYPDTEPSGAEATDPSGFAGRCAVEIQSRHRTRVDLQLDPGAQFRPLRVHALHAPLPGAPPLTALSFRGEPSGVPLLAVSIPDHQPAGLYSGLVVDAETNEPAGTLTVHIAEPSAS